MSGLPASSTDRRVQRLRRDLVLQLALNDGPFWEAVQGLRAAWGIEAVRDIPWRPGRLGLYVPPQLADDADNNPAGKSLEELETALRDLEAKQEAP